MHVRHCMKCNLMSTFARRRSDVLPLQHTPASAASLLLFPHGGTS